MNISPSSMLALIMLAHLFADYTLQGCLADLKQKSWWEKQLGKIKATKEQRHQYRNDYKAALVCHSLYWSLIICLPLLMLGGSQYLIQSLFQAAAHYYIDDQKANKHAINLVIDQLFHAVQLLAVWGLWLMGKGIAV